MIIRTTDQDSDYHFIVSKDEMRKLKKGKSLVKITGNKEFEIIRFELSCRTKKRKKP